VPATAFKNIKAPRLPGEREENETEKGLRVADRGFLNTAVIRSKITHIDGEAGGMYGPLSLLQKFSFEPSSVLRYRYAS
jgi:citrate synthase